MASKPGTAIRTDPSSGATGFVCAGARAGNVLLTEGLTTLPARDRADPKTGGDRRGPAERRPITCGRQMTERNSGVGMRSVVMNVREVACPPVERLLEGP